MNEMHEEPLPGGSERKWKAVYTIVEKVSPDGRAGERRSFWVRVGTAFVNRDQSMNVKLDAVPTNGTLHIREYQPFDEQRRNDERAPWAAPKGAM